MYLQRYAIFFMQFIVHIQIIQHCHIYNLLCLPRACFLYNICCASVPDVNWLRFNAGGSLCFLLYKSCLFTVYIMPDIYICSLCPDNARRSMQSFEYILDILCYMLCLLEKYFSGTIEHSSRLWSSTPHYRERSRQMQSRRAQPTNQDRRPIS